MRINHRFDAPELPARQFWPTSETTIPTSVAVRFTNLGQIPSTNFFTGEKSNPNLWGAEPKPGARESWTWHVDQDKLDHAVQAPWLSTEEQAFIYQALDLNAQSDNPSDYCHHSNVVEGCRSCALAAAWRLLRERRGKPECR